MSSARPTTSRAVNAMQLVSLLLAFVLVAGVGGVLSAALAMPFVAAAGATSTASQELFDGLPDELTQVTPSELSRIYASDGTLLATYFIQNRIVVAMDEISPHMANAVVAVEDRRYYEHNGVDMQGTLRALVTNVMQGDIQGGGSTLTQQYVKNVLLESGRINGDPAEIEAATAESYGRKLREAKLAIGLEQVLSKDQILEGYLNIAQFGAGQYGVESAARYYFNKSAVDLSIAESAMLAGITQSPGRWDPVRNPDDDYAQTTTRRDTVLALMLQEGFITPEEHAEAVATPIADMLRVTPSPVGCQTAGISAYFCQYVTEVLIKDGLLGETEAEARQALNRGGLSITTTIDLLRQQQAYDSLVDRLPVNDATYVSKEGERGVSGAISTVEPGTGNIVAMVQNTPFANTSEDQPRATLVNFNVDQAYGGGEGFQTGSAFKTFVLTEWLNDGRSLSDIVDGSNSLVFPRESWRQSCEPDSADTFEPNNLETGARGRMSVMTATEQSVNTAYAYMANQLDLCDIADTAARMGVNVGTGTVGDSNPALAHQADNPLYVSPGMVLGANSIAPLTMAAAFATYANDGVYCEPRSVLSIVDTNGNELPVPEPQCTRAISSEVANGVNHALQSVVERGTATGAQIGRPAAGKTGTANMDYHAWFVGYTPQLSTAVWAGHHEGQISMFRSTINGRYYQYVYGGGLSAPIWGSYMSQAMNGMEVRGFAQADERTIYGERIPVPGVIGQSIEAATRTLEEAGFAVSVGSAVYSDNVPRGAVAQQSPGASSRATLGSVITLLPSQGPEPQPSPSPSDPPGDEGEGDDGDDD